MPDDNDITMIPGPPTSWWSERKSDFPILVVRETDEGVRFTAMEQYLPVDDRRNGDVFYFNVNGDVAGGLSGLKPEESAWLERLHRHGS